MSNDDTSSFRGFKRPRYTQVPDELIDDIMVDLSGAELKVLLYIVRHTFGYGKDSDAISLNQMINGIQRRDGTVVDRGTGLSKKTLLAAINTLESRSFILTERRRSLDKGDEPTAYRLNIDDRPIVEKSTPPVGEKLHQGGGGEITPGGWGNYSPTQETTKQETIKQDQDLSNLRKADNEEKKDEAPSPRNPALNQETATAHQEVSTIRQIDIHKNKEQQHQAETPPQTDVSRQEASTLRTASNPRKLKLYAADDDDSPPAVSNGFESIGSTPNHNPPFMPPSAAEAREVIEAYIRDFAQELHDAAPIKSSVSRAFRLYQQSGWTLDGFISVLYEARSITKERSAGIQANDHATTLPAKRKMAYFFACLEDKLGLREQPADDAHG